MNSLRVLWYIIQARNEINKKIPKTFTNSRIRVVIIYHIIRENSKLYRI